MIFGFIGFMYIIGLVLGIFTFLPWLAWFLVAFTIIEGVIEAGINEAGY